MKRRIPIQSNGHTQIVHIKEVIRWVIINGKKIPDGSRLRVVVMQYDDIISSTICKTDTDTNDILVWAIIAIEKYYADKEVPLFDTKLKTH